MNENNSINLEGIDFDELTKDKLPDSFIKKINEFTEDEIQSIRKELRKLEESASGNERKVAIQSNIKRILNEFNKNKNPNRHDVTDHDRDYSAGFDHHDNKVSRNSNYKLRIKRR